MLVPDEADIAKLLDMDAALAAVRTALLDVCRGTARNLAKERASLDGQTLHSTGAVLRTGPVGPSGGVGPGAEGPGGAGGGAAARTWHGATIYVSGSVRAHWTLVFNGDEGLRAVVAGKTLARLRTGAASGVSAGALARPGPITLACIGAGYQAWTQVEAVSRVRPIGRLLVWSRTRERAEGFAARVRDGLGLPATPVAAVRGRGGRGGRGDRGDQGPLPRHPGRRHPAGHARRAGRLEPRRPPRSGHQPVRPGRRGLHRRP